jgi:putative heme iron utilization protein
VSVTEAAANAARGLLRTERHGVLATLSRRREGWPFASLAPYALSAAGEPLLLLSDLAEHTRNLVVDPRASLFVRDSSAMAHDPQAGARLTLLGRVEPVDDPADAQQRYVARHPSAAEYLGLSDFRFFVLRVTEARYIGGFGDMGWIDGASLST